MESISYGTYKQVKLINSYNLRKKVTLRIYTKSFNKFPGFIKINTYIVLRFD